MEEMLYEFAFHEQAAKKPYFEGWYIKSVANDISFAVIWGISITKHSQKVFIQTNDTMTDSHYEEWPLASLQIIKQPFVMKVGKNMLSQFSMSLHLSNGIECELVFSNLRYLNATSYQPTIMGPFAYITSMECIHSIISLHHKVTGYVRLQQHTYHIQGLGYIEKDRGISFPSSYIWFQSNHSNVKTSCLFLSIAHIPFHHMSFQGCICALMLNKKQYRFATYLGCSARYIKEKQIYVLTQLPYKVYIKIIPHHTSALKAPVNGDMTRMINESLTSEAIIHVYHFQKRIIQLHFKKGGYEFVE